MQMRRMICAAFACILAVGTLAIPASAIENVEAVADDNVVHYGINELNPDDFIYIAPQRCKELAQVICVLNFLGAVYNSVYSDFIENVITAGASAILNVNTCVWAPEPIIWKSASTTGQLLKTGMW